MTNERCVNNISICFAFCSIVKMGSAGGGGACENRVDRVSYGFVIGAAAIKADG